MILDLTKEKVWRIKTFEEFKESDTLGCDDIPIGWNLQNKMSFLYGLEITEEQAKDLQRGVSHVRVDAWFIKKRDIIYSYPVLKKDSVKKENSDKSDINKEPSICLLNTTKKPKQFTNFKIFK